MYGLKVWGAFGLVNKNATMCQEGGTRQVPGTGAPVLRTVPDVALCISSAGRWFVSFNVLCNKAVVQSACVEQAGSEFYVNGTHGR